MTRLLRRFGLDIILWYVAPGLFLWAYVVLYGKSSAAIAPHALVAALPLLTIVLARLVLAPLFARTRLFNVVVALLTSALLGALVLYYCLVLIGLRSWGGVVAWNVIPTFFAQVPVLADSLGVPTILLPITLSLLYIGLTMACWNYLQRFDWSREWTSGTSRVTLAVVVVSGVAIVAVESYQISLGLWSQDSEPMSLTLAPATVTLDLEGYSVNPVIASHLDHMADSARQAYKPAAATRKKNLVLIVVDALRPDHMGIYGYGRDTTPGLMRIGKENDTRIISEVHSSCADTICALFSLFSSKFPSEFSFHPFSLHEALRRNGYRIHLALSGDFTFFYALKSFYGHVDSFYDGTQAHGYYLDDDQLVVDRLEKMPYWDGAPVMFQIHLMSAHILRKNEDVPGRYQPQARYALRGSSDTGPGGSTSATAVNFYDNGVIKADSVIDTLLRTLATKGYLNDTMVVITADHGESLGEHGLFTHANSVREEALRIPLVVISFGYQSQLPKRLRGFPSQVDIAPTILTELGLPIPTTWVGQPLQLFQGPVFSFFQEHSFAGLIDHRDPAHVWKYWADSKSGADHVFDLVADPHENRDAVGEVPSDRLSEWRALTRTAASAGLALQ